jgi:hypothetical protein
MKVSTGNCVCDVAVTNFVLVEADKLITLKFASELDVT